jgi:hypothetical protein
MTADAPSNSPLIRNSIAPPASLTAARTLDDGALSRFTGQTAIRTVEEAKRLHESAEAELVNARVNLRRARLKVASAMVRVAVSQTGAPPILTGVVAGGALAIFLGIVDVSLGMPLALILFLSLGALIGVAVPLTLISGDNPMETDDNRRAGRRQEFAAATAALSLARSRVAAALSELPRRTQLLKSMQAAAAHRLNVTESDEVRRLAAMARAALQERLVGIDRSLLSGPEFERHLVAIFEVLGYVVEYRGRTGDQGVDLVLSTGGERIAVQAKCYSGSVGNDAVQQAHAGKTFRECQRCAVVTNSYFTSSARELAQSVSCTLVDGQKLPELIRGTIRL